MFFSILSKFYFRVPFNFAKITQNNVPKLPLKNIPLFFFSVPSKAPTNFTGHNTSSISLLIKWTSIPQEYIHGILLGYKIFYARTSGANIPYETLTVSPDALTTELTGLWKNTEYCVRVAGFTRRGDGNLTDCLNIATDQDCKYINIYDMS